MQAKETKLQDIIEGTKQYVIPLFQRTYSWTSKEWEILWKDLVELCETENPRTHFIGSIVNMPTVSVPEGVAKYLLIDGQQRLTTIFIILTLLRNKARENQNEEFAGEINNTLLVNPYKKDNDFYKLMPTQVDREIYKNFINGRSNEKESQLTRAYDFFEKKLRQYQLDPEKLKKIITTYFSVVSILLDADDNPYLVFESLNAKGRPLTQADLIRNYFFMRIHVDKQEQVYSEFWQPMQDALEDNLTEFIRHFLMKEGSIIKQTDVYYELKDNVNPQNSIIYLENLQKHSLYYQKILYPDYENDKDLQKYFRRLNRFEVTTAYPLLLKLYNYYVLDTLPKEDFITALQTIENYLIRRFVCGIPTNQLNKIFPAIIPQLISKYELKIPEGLQYLLQTKGYPKDNEFRVRLKEAKLYGSGDRYVKTKLILESLEEYFGHKENVLLENLTIEHVMPQTLSEAWQSHLGEEWEETHELYLHTIGNLTLTAYNTELSNDDFSTKREIFIESHLELNKYFIALTKWTKEEIDERSESLANKAIEMWPYFGHDNSFKSEIQEVTGTIPTEVKILGQSFSVKSWRDVLELTLNTVADLEPEKFEIIAHNFPRYLGREKNKFRAVRELENGYFLEVNLSAQNIQRLCYQAMETIELSSEDWKVAVE
ncbi:hypothetical protein AAE02nite_18040 [Adhaeribacter aerolatus]|uniref:DUF262 domain-containing protein n=1 Tax=Adhaeribacter aerolatus TaxID=670289 RepID=A0A512AWU2_9BACT|nr:DUF262 domain-containing protein [Adhaeribacter aerolatus]GEO04140.1 hypothetical protein AAE02nite_18040 [Adhaeribacter aerolatus]